MKSQIRNPNDECRPGQVAGFGPPATFEVRDPSWVRRHSPGFTLIEIMIVVAIIAIIMALGLPPFVHSLNQEPLRQASRDVVEACQTARARAILQGTRMEVVFRAEDSHIAVRPAPADTGTKPGAALEVVAPAEAAAGEIWGRSMDPEVRVRFLDVNLVDYMDAPTARVRFFPDGTSDEFTIVIESSRGGARKISLEVVTALADVTVLR